MRYSDLLDQTIILDITDSLVLNIEKLKGERISIIKETINKIIKNSVIVSLSDIYGLFIENYERPLNVKDLDNKKLIYETYIDIKHAINNILFYTLKTIYKTSYYVDVINSKDKIIIILTAEKKNVRTHHAFKH